MLGVRTYSKEYVDGARARIDGQLSSYRALAAAARGVEDDALDASLAALEPQLFNNMMLALEQCFCHRLRGVEGKDGNALNELRVLAASLMENGGRMGADKTIKLKPAESLLRYEPGATIALREADFALLADAFFAEIEQKFV